MKDSRITFRISEAEKKAIELMAARKDIPLSQYLREMIREEIKGVKDNGI